MDFLFNQFSTTKFSRSHLHQYNSYFAFHTSPLLTSVWITLKSLFITHPDKMNC